MLNSRMDGKIRDRVYVRIGTSRARQLVVQSTAVLKTIANAGSSPQGEAPFEERCRHEDEAYSETSDIGGRIPISMVGTGDCQRARQRARFGAASALGCARSKSEERESPTGRFCRTDVYG